jgi:hypothetical protein
MKFLQRKNVDEINLPFNISEIADNPHLKYLLNSVYRIAFEGDEKLSQRSNVHFILAEDYKELVGYIPIFLLFSSRLNYFEQNFGCSPKRFRQIWKPEVYDVNNNKRLKITYNGQTKTQKFDALLLSLIPEYKNYGVSPYCDTQSVVFFTNTTKQENDLLKSCHINHFPHQELFNRCRIDSNNAWDGESSLIISRLSCIEQIGIFENLHQEIPIKSIVLTFEAIQAYISEIIPPDDEEDPFKFKIKAFYQNLHTFTAAFEIPKVIITATAENCLLVETFADYIFFEEDPTNQFMAGNRHIILKNDFKEVPLQAPLINSRLKYHYRSNVLINSIFNLESQLNELEKSHVEIPNLYNTKNSFYRLKLKIFSLIPRRFQEIITLLNNSIHKLQLKENEKEKLVNQINVITQNLINYPEDYKILINSINGDDILIYSDNHYDYNVADQRIYNINNQRVRAIQINWSGIEIPAEGKSFIYSISLPSWHIPGKIYDCLFKLAANRVPPAGEIYLLMSKRDLMIAIRIIHAIENSVENFRSPAGLTTDVKIISFDQFESELNLADDQIVENVDDYVQRSFNYIQRKNAGLKRSKIDGQTETVDLAFIDEYNNDEVINYYGVPAGRLYNLVDENDDKKKRADELEQGDRLLILFDERDNTYDSIRELLRERNTNEFDHKYTRGSLWINALKKYKEKFSLNKLASDIGFPDYRIRYWLNVTHVMPDEFEKLIDAIKNLIRNNTSLFPSELIHQIGPTEKYVQVYNEVYHTPRRIYRQIIGRIKNNEEIDYGIIQYNEIFEELREGSRILKVLNAD